MGLGRQGSAALLLLVLAAATPYQLRTRINTEEVFRSPEIAPDRVYSIEVSRLDSSKAAEVSRCWAVPRAISVVREREIVFRLSAAREDVNREQKVYQKLTQLGEQENIIEQFTVAGQHVFLLTSDGSAYFLPLDPLATRPPRIQTTFFSQDRASALLLLRPVQGGVLVLTKAKAMLCTSQGNACRTVDGYESLKRLKGAQVLEEEGRQFVFLVDSQKVVVFQLGAKGELMGRRTFDAAFFGAEKVNFREVVRVAPGSVFVLDALAGVRELTAKKGLAGTLEKGRLVFEQFGCYHMLEQEGGEGLVLACNPSFNHFFLLSLSRSQQFANANYEPLETVFMQDQIYQIEAADKVLMARVYSGVRLFWTSRQLGSPYPYFYRSAGNVFLHNAIQSQLRVVNGSQRIFMAAEDEIHEYQLRSYDPFVACYSPVPLSEEYRLKYQVECKQASFMGRQAICSQEQVLRFETWQHREVRVTTHILPFLVSLVGLVLVGYAVWRARTTYRKEVDEARFKYQVEEHELSL